MLPLLSFSPQAFARKGKPILLLVELKGANDALNTLVPVKSDEYYRLRPNISLQERDTVSLGSGFAMHKSMLPLMPDWESGCMGWIHGLGYDNPNRSHFRSIEIWESGSEQGEHDSEGWISKLFPETVDSLNGVVLGSDYGPLAEAKFNKIVMENTKDFLALTKRLTSIRNSTTNSALTHVLNIQNNIHDNVSSVVKMLEHSKDPIVSFPNDRFGKQMEQAAFMIKSNLGAMIYKVELGSFDTHSRQKKRHDALLSSLSKGLAAFSEEMKASGLWSNILIMSYSEFGRRVSENKSGGTDHGTAAAHFVMGGRVRGGFHGKHPSLRELDGNGDIIHTTDFKSLYDSVAREWFKVDSPWEMYRKLNLIHA